MKPAWCHPWDVTPAVARQWQIEARRRLVLEDPATASIVPPELIAVDVGYDRATNLCAAALVVWDADGRRPRRCLTHAQPSTFPYVPGLLSFREIPALLPLFRRLRARPELVICDAQGYAHPRRIGMAAHLGVVLDCPTLGWAKTRLIGAWRGLAPATGAATPLMDQGEQIGWVFRSRAGCKPTFISPGHRMSMGRALACARALAGPYRLCEPIRLAHQFTRQAMLKT